MTAAPQTTAEGEIASGARFDFGANWHRFLSTLNDDRIAAAEQSLRTMLDVTNLEGVRFLDVGSGSGLFSLAARRLGARVNSFDYDPSSVACTRQLKQRFFTEDDRWTIGSGSVLDRAFLRSLGTFDVVYAWGVLHHTGALHQAMENVAGTVADGGKLFVAIYNDQGAKSAGWLKVKRLYCSSQIGRWIVSAVFIPYFVLGGLALDLVRGKNPIARYGKSQTQRGMSRVRDWFDWLGGLPFEVAEPEAVVRFFEQHGFRPARVVTCGRRSGCNEFVFVKDGGARPPA